MEGLPLLVDVIWKVSHCWWMLYGGSPAVCGCCMEGLPHFVDETCGGVASPASGSLQMRAESRPEACAACC